MLKESLLLATSLLAVCSSATYAQRGTGSISGTVVNERGTPIAGVRVGARLVGRVLLYQAPYTETDVRGYFSIDRLQWGQYSVFAMKLASGYPNTEYSSFYGDGSGPKVTITPAAPTATVHIRLGSKAGILTGSVKDADTGAPVNAGFKLIRAASPGDWLSTSQPSSYRVLLPPRKDVLIRVSAPGYKTWDRPKPFRLQSGEEMHLDISLRPSRNPEVAISEFLIPNGYVGWIQLECDVKNAPATPVEKGVRVFKFPSSGTLFTSSRVPEKGSEKRFFYYTSARAIKDVLTRYRSGHGLVWGGSYGSEHGVISEFHFFVGTEEEYKKQGYHGLQRPQP
ncbi:MAG TPA: carboxypeptidase regulatory-like domain-containing protein [Candidatus Sulfotelmatobacter sp.]|nr:carboxypeptidase regulatory-like domain-containing protein [Candidatus Sulfotelmatobacter sp.]